MILQNIDATWCNPRPIPRDFCWCTIPQAGGVVQRLAVDGLALVYHVMKNTKDRRLYLELG